MKIIAIIPARYQSTRFPGKPLALIQGYPMVWHVYRRVKRVEEIHRVLVATDDQRIREAVEELGGEAVMTSAHHPSGTDRIAAVAAEIPCQLVVNVQGDEPLIEPGMIREALSPLQGDEEAVMSTLKKRIEDPLEVKNPHLVKVVTDREGYALYFSRSPLPYHRQEEPVYYGHIGLYVYRRDFLLRFSELEPTPLEQAEALEQLRVLENGYRIKVVETEEESIGVDTPEDLEEVRRLIQRR